MNYLPAESKVIRNKENRAVKVVAIWQNQGVPFIMKGGKIIREDYSKPNRIIVPEDDYRRMYRQVTAVFNENRIKDRCKELYWLVRDLDKCGVTIRSKGRLRIIRWDKKVGKKPKSVSQMVEDIETAIRMQDHIIDSYLSAKDPCGELSQLESIEMVITEANRILLNWRQTDTAKKEKLQRQLVGVVLQLEKCRNEFKIRAMNQAAQISSLKDSLGRPNPGAFAARTIKALAELTERIKEINIIEPYIAMRKELLVLADRWMRSNLNQAAGAINLISKHRVFRNGQIAEHEPKIIMQQLDRASLLLNNAIISPHYSAARKAKAELKEAEKLLKNKNYSAAFEKLNLARTILTKAA